MKKQIFIFIITILVFTACNNNKNNINISQDGIIKPKAPKAEGPKRVLFIGNNHTEYYVSAPTLFQELCNANNQYVEVQQLTTMGVSLDKVYDTNKTEANQNFSNRDKDGNYYDYVILQEATPIALSDIEKYRANLKMIVEKIHVNSPGVAVYLYEGLPPVSYTNSKFGKYYKELRKNAILAMVFIKNAGLLRVGDATKDAYDGKSGYNYLLNNKDNLRYEHNNTLLALNDSGFLQATLLYATIFDKKPIVPKKLILSTGTGDEDCMRRQEVKKVISNTKALEEIAFNNR